MQKFLGYIFDIGLLSFNDGTDPMDKFVPNVIDDKHFIFPLFDFPFKVSFDFGIVVDCSHGTHMEMFFECSVCHRMDSGFSIDRRSRGIFKWYDTTITSQLFWIIIFGEEASKNGKMKCRDLSYSSNRSNQSDRFIEPVIRKDQFFDIPFYSLNLASKIFIDFFKVLFGKLSHFWREEFKFIGILIKIGSGIDQLSSDLEQYSHFFKDFWNWFIEFELTNVFRGVLRNTDGIDPIIFTSVKSYALRDLDGHLYAEARFFFNKFGNDEFSIDTGMFHTGECVFQWNLLIFQEPDKSIRSFFGILKNIRGSPIFIQDSYVKSTLRYINTDEVRKVLVLHNDKIKGLRPKSQIAIEPLIIGLKT